MQINLIHYILANGTNIFKTQYAVFKTIFCHFIKILHVKICKNVANAYDRNIEKLERIK